MKASILPHGTGLVEEISSRLQLLQSSGIKTDSGLIPDKRGGMTEEDYSGNDFSRYLVVFPGKRPSHFLRKAIGRSLNGPFVPPVVLSMDEFVDFVYTERLGIYDRKIEVLDAIAVLHGMHLSSSWPIGGGSFMALDDFFHLGVPLYHALEELYVEMVPQSSVKSIDHLMDDSVPAATARNIRKLSEFYEGFYESVPRRGYSTRSTRYVTVAARLQDAGLEAYDGIFMAGFFALTTAEKEIFRKLAKLDMEDGLRPANSADGSADGAGRNDGHKVELLFQDGAGIGNRLAGLGLNDLKPAESAASTTTSKSSTAPTTVSTTASTSASLTASTTESATTSLTKSAKAATRISFYKSPDTHGQVLALSSLLKELHGELDERSVIALPSPETLFPLLYQSLPLVEDYNVSLGYPLQRTPLFGFFTALMELVATMDGDRFYAADYLKFVLHPYVKNIYMGDKTDVTRITFHTIEEKLNGSRTRPFVSLAEIEEDEEILSSIASIALKLTYLPKDVSVESVRNHLHWIHENTVGKLLGLRNIGGFALRCMEVLSFIYEKSTAKIHPYFHPFSESLMTALKQLAGSLLKDAGFAEPAGYFNLFRHYIAATHTPFPGTPLNGLQVLGFLETRSIKFDRVFILDANEEVLPSFSKDDSLLPFKARKFLGLPTYHDREQLFAYYFDVLVQGSREAHVFFIENDRKEKSRLVEKLLWEMQKNAGGASGSASFGAEPNMAIHTIQYNIKLKSIKPSSVPKSSEIVAIIKKQVPLSATSLDMYLKCPLKFYYRYVARLDKKEKLGKDVDRADIGLFVHDVLRQYFRPFVGQYLSGPLLSEKEMARTVDLVFEKTYGSRPVGSAYLLREQVRKRMTELVSKYYAGLCESVRLRLVALEEEFGIVKRGITLTGRMDRIEERDGATVVVDYKTSSSDSYLRINFDKLDLKDRATWPVAIGSLQLPLYLMLYAGKRGISQTEIATGLNGIYLILGRAYVDGKIEVPFFGEGSESASSASSGPEKIARYAAMEGVIDALLEELGTADVPFTPARDVKRTCPSCTFENVCGT
ncbi:MAG: PD-(D/E)XK nuclease family protein [Nitrospirae bacterium]|nr:PD-(D/E)XK nuclease family protein [Nitrospirota bacterium]